MRINVCVPTRGKPGYLKDFVVESVANAALPDTRFVVAYDDDDTAALVLFEHDRVISSLAEREDSLGAKYNRCVRAYPADLYILSMDDVAIATKGWDVQIAEAASVFKDGIGHVYFGKEPNGEYLPSMIAVTRKVVDTVGFCPEFFPFWWCNTWIHERAQFIGRAVRAEIAMRYPPLGQFPEPPRRDVAYWAQFFDRTRPLRMREADTLLALMDDGPTQKAMTAYSRPALVALFEALNAYTRELGESVVVVRDEDNPRHARLKAKADALVAASGLAAI